LQDLGLFEKYGLNLDLLEIPTMFIFCWKQPRYRYRRSSKEFSLRILNTITGATRPSATSSKDDTKRSFVTGTPIFWSWSYIHLNPVRMKNPEDLVSYRWSSHHAYTGNPGQVTVDTALVLEQFGSTAGQGRKAYRKFI